MRSTLFTVILAFDAILSGASAQQRGHIANDRPRSRSSAEANARQPMEAPVVGFVSRSVSGVLEVRPILGVPGATVLGDPMALPSAVAAVHFAPREGYALVEQTNDAPVGVLQFIGADAGPLTTISGAILRLDILSFSPNGAAAAAFSSGEGRLQVITGLPDAPQVARELRADDIPNNPAFLAIADDGVTLLEGTSDGNVYLLPDGDAPRFLYTAGDLGALVFAPGSGDAVLADRASGRVVMLQGVGGPLSALVLADGLMLNGNIAIQVDGGRAFVASAESADLWRIDLQSLQLQDVQLPANAAMLQPLRAASTFLLSSEAGQPAWVLNASAGGNVYFVPGIEEKQ